MLLNNLQSTGQPPTAENYLAMNVNRAAVETPASETALVKVPKSSHDAKSEQLFSMLNIPSPSLLDSVTLLPLGFPPMIWAIPLYIPHIPDSVLGFLLIFLFPLSS